MAKIIIRVRHLWEQVFYLLWASVLTLMSTFLVLKNNTWHLLGTQKFPVETIDLYF